MGEIETGKTIPHRESQSPAFAGILSIAVTLIMLVAAYFLWSQWIWLSIIFIIIAIGMLSTFGGFRTTVNRANLTVKMGFMQIPLLNLKTSEMVTAGVHSFKATRDFGGYGIRFNQDMQAFFLKGGSGVKVTTADGKNYLIGSDQPETLLAAVNEVIGGKP